MRNGNATAKGKMTTKVERATIKCKVNKGQALGAENLKQYTKGFGKRVISWSRTLKCPFPETVLIEFEEKMLKWGFHNKE